MAKVEITDEIINIEGETEVGDYKFYWNITDKKSKLDSGILFSMSEVTHKESLE